MANVFEIIPQKEITKLTKANKVIVGLDESTLKWVSSVEKLSAELSKTGVTFKQISAASKKQQAAQKDSLTLDEKRKITNQALLAQQKAEIRTLAKMEAALKREVKTKRDLELRTAALIQQQKRLDRTDKNYLATNAKLTREIRTNTEALKRQESQMGMNQRNVGNYTGAVNKAGVAIKGMAMQLAGALGLTAGVYMFVRAIKSAIKKVVDFEKALSSLRAITGLSAKDMIFFSKKAIEFSHSFLLSALDIVQAFERIGSIRPELLRDKEALAEVTKQAILLSQASGGKLSIEDAATAAAGSLNQFGKSTEYASKATDILVAAQTYGSAMIADLTASFKTFGTVASDSNLTMIQAAALIEVVGRKNLFAEEAGTKLRSTLINLKKAGVGYTNGMFNMRDALIEVNDMLSKLTTAREKDMLKIKIFGKRNITVGTILLKNIGLYDELSKKLDENGIALDKARTQADNVSGSFTLLGNAWDALVLSFSSSKGVLKSTIDSLTMLLNGITTANFKWYDFLLLGIPAMRKYNAAINENASLNRARIISETEFARSDLQFLQQRLEGVKKILKANTDLSDSDRTYYEERYRLLSEEIVKRIKANVKEKKAAQDSIATKETEIITIDSLKKQVSELTKKIKDLRDERGKIDITNTQELIQNQLLIDSIIAQKKAIELLITAKENLGKARHPIGNVPTTMATRGGPTDITQPGQLPEIKPPDYQPDVDNYQRSMEEKISIAQSSLNLISQAYDIFYQQQQQRYNEDMARVSRQRAYELKLAVGNQEKINEINKKYDKKEAQLKTKKAKDDKQANIIKATISIAQGILSALTIPPPAGYIFAAFTAALGAIQLGLIASQPIPKFAKGTESAPDGVIEVGERGRELITTKSGQMFLANRPTFAMGLGGARIESNPETERILAGGGYDSGDIRELIDSNRAIESAIKNKKEIHIYPEKREIRERKGSYWKTYKNSYFG